MDRSDVNYKFCEHFNNSGFVYFSLGLCPHNDSKICTNTSNCLATFSGLCDLKTNISETILTQIIYDHNHISIPRIGEKVKLITHLIFPSIIKHPLIILMLILFEPIRKQKGEFVSHMYEEIVSVRFTVNTYEVCK